MPTITSGGLFSNQARSKKPEFSELIWSGQQLLHQQTTQNQSAESSKELVKRNTAGSVASSECGSDDESRVQST
ncbi:uncharacterized protein MELLADRAFT_70846 [Melampsora larici-populina 98AG31]|uniref:Uncharacterized protein n=1 Tax=Melampsora larici-populina (strain 98AG31 / pathotype 3-4-7) TaxID=747676 RepID=F4R740_MELLP|nr:uncharacterized protein MELLADRAFT_70846 [Melampsora larici-populina 98AG31]EGG11516.1 hypothetical protein MELLADRAFT_70846 [Melampsora larici-populina 98AG31]